MVTGTKYMCLLAGFHQITEFSQHFVNEFVLSTVSVQCLSIIEYAEETMTIGS